MNLFKGERTLYEATETCRVIPITAVKMIKVDRTLNIIEMPYAHNAAETYRTIPISIICADPVIMIAKVGINDLLHTYTYSPI